MKLGQLVDVLAGKAFMKYVEWFKWLDRKFRFFLN